MADNIGEGFVDSARQGPAFPGGKAQLLGQAHHCAADDAQEFRIAGQFKPE
jgi:hypothetical protein